MSLAVEKEKNKKNQKTSCSPQRELAVNDTSSNDVLNLPSGGLDGSASVLPPLSLVFWCDALGQRVQTTSNSCGVLELEKVGNLVTGNEHSVEVILVVGGRDAEASTRADERSGGITDDDDGDFAGKHLATEGRHLSGVVKQDGDDG